MSRRRDPDDLIARAGRGDPRRDQHFLVDDRVLDRIPTYADDFDTSHVLEIGPGTGALTDRLLAVADQVTVVERDADFATFVRSEFATAVDEGRLTVVQGDALSVDFPEYTTCISNLPYGVSTEVTFRLLPTRNPAVLMFQKEVGERMAADPGTAEYGRLSVAAQHYATVEVVEPVPPAAFDPQPAVDSVVVRLTPRDPEYRVPDEDAFLLLVKAMFTQRRKTVRNAIRNTAHISGLSDPDAVVEALDESLLSRRPDALEPAAFARIATVAGDIG
ncbi:16S rRNA A1518 and A1519 N6-dimethyltransferase RsmA/KsgA/DIM1 [Halanaeroarchaeum sp. HSR-CO]|uniref:16S ribosomal RNA methyltransferase A n=1 Tax=Halanaeroarchaeum sp. HSR-CO TaxID=2866382 RepID=UPI00217DAC2D|nr:16S ribosomal RNA methyltransferase A [Halanaeroarchaeum sp. HSR-CO]UWG48289.1 16S rRNA A1518 and A1519 N6-dimethyltransferase RsmA/KsgA/DIM1 [Halanaeroarchaeum sp. HSR-CO]